MSDVGCSLFGLALVTCTLFGTLICGWLMLSRVSGVPMVTRSDVFVLGCSSFRLILVTCPLFGSLPCGGLSLSRASGVSMVTRFEVFVIRVVRLLRVVSYSLCTCVGRVGLGKVMVSEALCAVGFLLVG